MTKKVSAINRKIDLSIEASEFIGKSSCTRGEMTKAIWAHIKKCGLKNEDGVVECDPELVCLLGVNRINKASDLFKIIRDAGLFLN